MSGLYRAFKRLIGCRRHIRRPAATIGNIRWPGLPAA